jgi:hypothetical protein
LSRQHSREEKLRVAGQRDLAGGVTTWWEEWQFDGRSDNF